MGSLTKCRACKRPLTNPHSAELGYGPTCYLKSVSAQAGEGDVFGRILPGDPRKKIIMRRDEHGNPSTNVPHQQIIHSPTGFEWGYGGSGPADLALNILRLYTEKTVAEMLHQKFKWEFISRLPYEGGVIEAETIRQWIAKEKEKWS